MLGVLQAVPLLARKAKTSEGKLWPSLAGCRNHVSDSSGNEAVCKQLYHCHCLKPNLGFSGTLGFINVKILDLQRGNNSAECPRTYTGYDPSPVTTRQCDHMLRVLF